MSREAATEEKLEESVQSSGRISLRELESKLCIATYIYNLSLEKIMEMSCKEFCDIVSTLHCLLSKGITTFHYAGFRYAMYGFDTQMDKSMLSSHANSGMSMKHSIEAGIYTKAPGSSALMHDIQNEWDKHRNERDKCEDYKKLLNDVVSDLQSRLHTLKIVAVMCAKGWNGYSEFIKETQERGEPLPNYLATVSYNSYDENNEQEPVQHASAPVTTTKPDVEKLVTNVISLHDELVQSILALVPGRTFCNIY